MKYFIRWPFMLPKVILEHLTDNKPRLQTIGVVTLLFGIIGLIVGGFMPTLLMILSVNFIIPIGILGILWLIIGKLEQKVAGYGSGFQATMSMFLGAVTLGIIIGWLFAQFVLPSLMAG